MSEELNRGKLKESNPDKFREIVDALNVKGLFSDLQGLSSRDSPWWMIKLQNGEDIIITDVDKLPEEANKEKEILKAQNILSLIAVPLMFDMGELCGFMGFDDTETTRSWSEEDIRLLRVAREMISSYIKRLRSKKALRRQEEYLLKAKEAAESASKAKSEFLPGDEDRAEERESEEKRTEKKKITSAKVLLVEDNIINQKIVVKLLERINYRVKVVGNGKEAVEILSKESFDAVLLDIQMPGMDGIETTEIIRNKESPVLNHEVPIVAVTAHAMKGDRERCLEASMNGYVTKPIDPKELYRILRRGYSRPRMIC